MRHLSILIAAVFLAGCVSTSQETGVYKTLGGIGYTVDGAMTAYADATVAGLISPTDQDKVQNLFNRYQPVYNAAVRAASQDMATLAPEELSAIAAELVVVILTATNP